MESPRTAARRARASAQTTRIAQRQAAGAQRHAAAAAQPSAVVSPAAQTRPASPAPAEELLLNRYRVVERRGTGGFGTVCTCWDTRLMRRVAIKRMPLAAQNGTTTVEDALSEARIACMLAHPNIVAVHDFEADGAYAYLVMEYVDGLNLAELLARVEGGVLTYEEGAHVLSSVAAALRYAHENRVLHLDIKPTNIMIDRQGTVKLADFGMSTLASAAGYADARGGTVGYMPPEQIQGMLVDERADLFSLAVVMWQALTGADPFLAPNAAASLKLIQRGPARPLVSDCPELAGAPEEAFARALEPAASARTSSVDELASALLPFLGDAEAGKASLKALVCQSGEDDEKGPAGGAWSPSDLPLDERLPPWLEPALERGLSAVAAFALLHATLPSVPTLDAQAAELAALAGCALTALWPPAGSLLGAGSLAAALLLVSPTNASLPLAAALAAAAALWWALFGREEHLATAALLLPCSAPSPIAGAAVAGFALDPLPAAATGAAGYLLGSLFAAALAEGFSAQACAASLLAAWTQPGFWIRTAGCAAAGAASSAVALRGSVRAGVAGQVVGMVVLVAAELAAVRMENGGIWGAPAGETVAVAIFWAVLMCFATVLRGPLYRGSEDEDVYEFFE